MMPAIRPDAGSSSGVLTSTSPAHHDDRRPIVSRKRSAVRWSRTAAWVLLASAPLLLTGCGSSDDDFGPTRPQTPAAQRPTPAAADPVRTSDTSAAGQPAQPAAQETNQQPQTAGTTPVTTGTTDTPSAQTPPRTGPSQPTKTGGGLLGSLGTGTKPATGGDTKETATPTPAAGIELTEQPETPLPPELVELFAQRGQVDITAGGNRLLWGERDLPLTIYDQQLQQTVKQLYGVPGQLSIVRSNADRSLIVAGTIDGKLKVWTPSEDADRTETVEFFSLQKVARRESASVTIDAHDGPVRLLVFLDDQRLLSGGDDGVIRIWHVPFRDAELQWQAPLAAQQADRIGNSGLMQLSDANRALSINRIADGQQVAAVAASEAPVALRSVSDDGRWVVSVAEDLLISVTDSVSGESHARWKHSGEPLASLAMSSGTGQVLATTESGELLVWTPDISQVQSTSLPALITPGTQLATTAGRILTLMPTQAGEPEGHEAEQAVPSFELVMLSADGSVTLRSADGQVQRQWKHETSPLNVRNVDVIGRTLLAITSDDADQQTIQIIHLDQAQMSSCPAGDEVHLLAQTEPDAVWIAAADGVVKRIRISDQTVLDQYELPQPAVALVVDKSAVLAVDDSGACWRMMPRLKQAIKAHRSPLTAAMVDSTEQLLITGAADGQVIVWQLAGGHPIAQYRRLIDGPVTALVELPETREIAAAYAGNRICIWKLNPAEPAVQKDEEPGEKPAGGLGGLKVRAPQVRAGAGANAKEEVDPGDTPEREIELTSRAWTLHVTGDPAVLIGGLDDRSIGLWNPDSGEELQRMTGHSAPVLWVQPVNEDKLVSVDSTYVIRDWQLGPQGLPQGPPVRPSAVRTNGRQIPVMELRDTEDVLVAGSQADPAGGVPAQMREADGQTARAALREQLPQQPTSTAKASELDPTLLANLTFDDLRPPQTGTKQLRPNVQLALSSNGETLAAVISWPTQNTRDSGRTDLRVWDVPSQVELRRWTNLRLPVSQLGISSDGRFVWTTHESDPGSRKSRERLLEQVRLAEEQQARGTQPQIAVPVPEVPPEDLLPIEGVQSFEIATGRALFAEWPISTVEFDADEGHLLLGLVGREGQTGDVVVLAEVGTLKPLATYQAFEAMCPAVHFVPESDWIVASIRERNQCRFLTLDRNTLARLDDLYSVTVSTSWFGTGGAKSQDAGFNQVFVSPNGRGMVTHGRFGTEGLRSVIWNKGTERFSPSRKTPLDEKTKGALILEPDELGPTAYWSNPGAQIAIRDQEGFQIVDVRSNESKREVDIESLKNRSVVRYDFVPDGRAVVMAEISGNATLWNLRVEREALTLEAHDGPMLDVSFSGDQRLMTTAGEEGRIKVWGIADWINARQP